MKTLVAFLAVLVGLFLFLLYSPFLLDFDPKPLDVPLPPFEGPLKVNRALNNGERLFENILKGPESMIFHGGYIYTSSEEGIIYKIKNGKITPIKETVRTCVLPYEEKKCGRTLGLRLAPDGLLYFVDAFKGIFAMNLTTESVSHILAMSGADGVGMRFPDDLDVDEEGNIYISDATMKWDLTSMAHLGLENDDTGRVLRFNKNTGKINVLMSNLHFPNGIQISKDGQSLLVCESLNRRIWRYNLKGQKAGTSEIFADTLPADPDNIRRSPRGYWVAFTTARNSSFQVDLFDKLGTCLKTKRVLVRAVHAISAVIQTMADFSGYHPFKEFAYKLMRGDYFLPSHYHSIVVEFDESGKMLRSLQSPEGFMGTISHAQEHEGYLYIGSFLNHFLGRVKL